MNKQGKRQTNFERLHEAVLGACGALDAALDLANAAFAAQGRRSEFGQAAKDIYRRLSPLYAINLKASEGSEDNCTAQELAAWLDKDKE